MLGQHISQALRRVHGVAVGCPGYRYTTRKDPRRRNRPPIEDRKIELHATVCRRTPRAVLFDLDGTLLDTAPDMVGALNTLREERSFPPLPFAAARPQVSHGAAALVRLGFPEVPAPDREALRVRFLELYSDRIADETRPFERVPELLGMLERAGIPWGVVTNKPAWLTDPLLQALGLSRRAQVVVSGDTLAERKPHPLPLLHAAQLLGLAPAECLYVGDAARDVQAARAAGMQVIVALFGYIDPLEMPRDWPADGWISSPLELLDWLGSPA
jgi:N-acetyl-D-muramate 6-phosphate phosphatase